MIARLFRTFREFIRSRIDRARKERDRFERAKRPPQKDDPPDAGVFAPRKPRVPVLSGAAAKAFPPEEESQERSA